jgi:acetyltransferase-like isoleucine patch superfamily enzyme
MAMLDRKTLEQIGFASLGRGVQISERASIYNPGRIHIGDNVRIDDFAVLAAGEGGILIGNFVHVAVGSTLIGRGAITMSDFSGLSSRVSIYSSSDDYSGRALTNPTVPAQFTAVTHAPVHLGRHVIVGSGSVLLPGVVIEDGCAVGALSLVTKRCESYGIYVGTPAVRVRERRQDLLNLEAELMRSLNKDSDGST